ncbi:HepT-like ribonuclease domain-containing protein [Flavobacterium restrictum]|uniref:DUF86 domain-containing protein n=1 Tax=Flavobacterium restrictum TaxID=2594428 RepID=A0A553E5R4_9FLAO|nr:DUF86 domain-containing protein [Flavobacterium restrictum]TRX40359.1 DUF86 domain-containing protein [Flavobacterium restrictum]
MHDKLGNKVRLFHIIDAINEIENYIKDYSLETFVANSMMFNATLRQLEIIGEASNRLSEDLLNENPTIPWARIIGLRNLVIHEYFGVDDLTIWNVIKVNLPVLKEKVTLLVSTIK